MVILSVKLATFLNVPPGSMLSYHEVLRSISDHIDVEGLMFGDGETFGTDAKLNELFSLDSNTTINWNHEIKHYLRPLYSLPGQNIHQD